MATPPPPGEQTHRPKSKRRLGCQTVLLVLMAVTLLVAGVVTWNWKSLPRHWKDNRAFLDKTPPAELTTMTRKLEQRVLFELTRLDRKTNQPYAIEITIPEANAWLTMQLPQWLANQGSAMPDHCTDPMVSVSDGRPVLAFQYDSPELKQVISIFFDLEPQNDGKVKFTATELMGGNQSVPALTTVTKLLKDNAPTGENAEQFNRAIQAIEGQVFDAVIPVDDVRHARVVDFDFREDRLIFTVRNEMR